MACPRCGGSQRREIAPGLWECQSPVTELFQAPKPFDLVGPAPVTPVTRSCGVRYQEGSGAGGGATPICQCGMFAVGACTECGQPVCGNCLKVVGGRVYCPTHGEQQQATAAVRAGFALAPTRVTWAGVKEQRGPTLDEARLGVTDLLARLRAAGSPGSILVEFETPEPKRRMLRGDTTVWQRNQLRAWVLQTQRRTRPVHETDSGATFEVREMVSDQGHYFTSARRASPRAGDSTDFRVDTDWNVPAQAQLWRWAERAGSEKGPFHVNGYASQDQVTWDKVYATLKALLP